MIPKKLDLREIVGDVPEAEYARMLGYPPGHEADGQARKLMRVAREWCAAHAQPAVHLRELSVTKIGRKNIEWKAVGDASGDCEGEAGLFRSATLARRLGRAEAHSLVSVQISSGIEIEGEVEFLTSTGELVEATFLDRYGAALVEWLVYSTEERLSELAHGRDMSVLPAMSPGHEDWTLRDQRWLLGCFGLDARAVELSESDMLSPRNALLAVFGLTHARHSHEEADSIPCQRCSWTPCSFRRKVEGALVAD